jgi:hypothetical protein
MDRERHYELLEKHLKSLEVRLDELTFEVNILRTDAERYWWLKDSDPWAVAVILWRNYEGTKYGMDELDRGIDVARGALNG